MYGWTCRAGCDRFLATLDRAEVSGDPSRFARIRLVTGVAHTTPSSSSVSTSIIGRDGLARAENKRCAEGRSRGTMGDRIGLADDMGVGGEVLRVGSCGALCILLGDGRSGLGVGKSGMSVSATADVERHRFRRESSRGEGCGLDEVVLYPRDWWAAAMSPRAVRATYSQRLIPQWRVRRRPPSE